LLGWAYWIIQKAQSDLTFSVPEQPALEDFNTTATIPFGVTVEHISRAM